MKTAKLVFSRVAHDIGFHAKFDKEEWYSNTTKHYVFKNQVKPGKIMCYAKRTCIGVVRDALDKGEMIAKHVSTMCEFILC